MELPEKFVVLIVDDEVDMHTLTRLTLKSLRYQERKLEFLSAHSGAEALEVMRARPDVAVILMDVIMESDQAGLEAVLAIREFNARVRILLRTGQPGVAPERESVDRYPIDGYLSKADLSNNRLHAAVTAALKCWVELERQHQHARLLFELALTGITPQRVLRTAFELCPCRQVQALWHHERLCWPPDSSPPAEEPSLRLPIGPGWIAWYGARLDAAVSDDLRLLAEGARLAWQ